MEINQLSPKSCPLSEHQYVSASHAKGLLGIWVEGEGCIFETKENAREFYNRGYHPNDAGVITSPVQFNGKTYYKTHPTNCWD